MIKTYGYIYLTTNRINGKRYVGQHARPIFDKYYYGSGVFLRSSIKKYGKENFKIQILEYCYSLRDLNDRETYWINKLGVIYERGGYNLRSGGGVIKLSQVSKDKISKSIKELMTKEHRRELSLKNKSFYEKMTEEEKKDKSRKISINYLNRSKKSIQNSINKAKITNSKKPIKEIEDRNRKISVATKIRFKNMTDNEKQVIVRKRKETNEKKSHLEKLITSNRRGESIKGVWRNRSIEEKQDISKKISLTFQNKSDEEKLLRVNKTKKTIELKTNEEKSLIKSKISNTLIEYNKFKDPKIEDERRGKISESYKNKTIEEKLKYSKKLKDAIKNRDPKVEKLRVLRRLDTMAKNKMIKENFDIEKHFDKINKLYSKQYIVAYTDGSCWALDPKKRGGYGVCIVSHNQDIFLDQLISEGPFENVTVSVMELRAILHTFKIVPKNKKLIVFSDSQYSVLGINIWAEGWDLDERPNGELFQQILDELEKFDTRPIIEWVPGHAGIDGNETADILASKGRKA